MMIKLSIWVFAQILMRIYVLFIVNQQIPILKAFREKIGRPNDYEKPMHHFNACMAMWAASILSLVQLAAGFQFSSIWCGVVGASMFGMMMLPFYMLFFNRGVNKGLGNDPNYLGSGAETDIKLTSRFGANAGKKIHTDCLILIIFFNVAYFLLTLFLWK